jgi:hypothetical protein
MESLSEGGYCCNVGTLPALSWRDWEEMWKASVKIASVVADFQPEHLIYMSLGLPWDMPVWYPSIYISIQHTDIILFQASVV